MSAQPMLEEVERWVLVPGFDDYMVSSLGRLKSKRRKHLGWVMLSPGANKPLGNKKHPYVTTNLTDENGVVHIVRIHQIVAKAFLGPRPTGMQVAHNNCNHRDNRLSNLRYATPAENQADSRHLQRRAKIGNAHLFKIALDILVTAKLYNVRASMSLCALMRWGGFSAGTLYNHANRRLALMRVDGEGE